MYPEEQQPKSYSDEEINDYRKTHNINPEVQHHKYAKLVLVLSFVLFASIVLGLSYFLTNSKDEKNDASVGPITQPLVQPETVESADITENWLLVKNLEYEIKIPDGWHAINQDKSVLLVSCDSQPDCYDTKPGNIATLEQTSGGRDGLQGFLFVVHPEGSSIDDYITGYALEKELEGGYSLYLREITEEPEDDFIGADMPVGTMEFIAIKQLDDGRVSYFSYSVTPSQTDPTNLVQEMINTLMIN